MTRANRRRAALLAATLALPGPAAAQGMGGLSFDGLAHDRNAPLEINSDMLEVDQAQGTARFSGNVVVAQGGLRLSAGRVEARYGTGEGGASGGIAAINASEGVVISAGPAAAEAREGSYDLDSGQLVMTGDVVLTQAGNVLSGQRLVIDVPSGTGRMEGRVRTVLQPGAGRGP